MDISSTHIVKVPSVAPVSRRTEADPLFQVAQELEASFLAEMLKSAGLGKSRADFGGGAGEDQFSSFLVRAQAEGMVASGGIGLAEAIFDSLKEQTENE